MASAEVKTTPDASDNVTVESIAIESLQSDRESLKLCLLLIDRDRQK